MLIAEEHYHVASFTQKRRGENDEATKRGERPGKVVAPTCLDLPRDVPSGGIRRMIGGGVRVPFRPLSSS